MLNSSIGNAVHHLLPCDIAWSLLSKEEKEFIHAANLIQNVERDDYANAEKYGLGRRAGGDNWKSGTNRLDTVRGRFLEDALRKTTPQDVLEIGPGGGFYTKQLCEYDSVSHYTGIDIAQSFLDFLKPFFETLSKRNLFECKLVQGQVPTADFNRKYDLILLYSVVHHIPNRRDLLIYLSQQLNPDGMIVVYDPAHYLPRILELCRKFFTRGYLKRNFFEIQANLSTHQFCTAGEYRRVIEGLPLDIVRIDHVYSNKVRSLPDWVKRSLAGLWAREIGVLFRKRRS